MVSLQEILFEEYFKLSDEEKKEISPSFKKIVFTRKADKSKMKLQSSPKWIGSSKSQNNYAKKKKVKRLKA
jgi:hypothetical protein